MTQTSTPKPKKPRPPAILIGEDDLKALNNLAERAGGHLAAAAEQLLGELDRARAVPSHKLPPETVRMGSHVTFTTGEAAARTVQLVFPDMADIAAARVSVLTPVGAALIGLTTGQSINWKTPDGRQHVLSVVAVEQPEVWPPEA